MLLMNCISGQEHKLHGGVLKAPPPLPPPPPAPHTNHSCDCPVIAWQKQIALPLIKAPNGAKAGELTPIKSSMGH